MLGTSLTCSQQPPKMSELSGKLVEHMEASPSNYELTPRPAALPFPGKMPCCSFAQLCPTVCNPMDCSMPGFPVLHHLLEFAPTRPLSWWCLPTISSSVVPLSSFLQSFPASGSFPVKWPFASGGQSIGASVSASVLPVNIWGWFPLGSTGLIFSQSKWFSRPQSLKGRAWSLACPVGSCRPSRLLPALGELLEASIPLLELLLPSFPQLPFFLVIAYGEQCWIHISKEEHLASGPGTRLDHSRAFV